jgi:hypothetical protein
MTDQSTNKVTQKNVTAEKVVGRDDNSTHNEYHFHPSSTTENKTLKKLLEEHEREKESDPAYKHFTEELNQFFRKAYEKTPRDLQEKLTDGNREHIVQFALNAKDRVTRKIQKFSNFKSAQDVFTYLLANIQTAFKHQIESKIKSGHFQSYQIDDLVREQIISPYMETLDGNSLDIDLNDLYGLLYFLTGNCYLEWD